MTSQSPATATKLPGDNTAAPTTSIDNKSHHRPGHFDNPWDTWIDRGFTDIVRWYRERYKNNTPPNGYLIGKNKPTAADYAAAFPTDEIDFNALANPPADAVQCLWIGHSSAIVQMEGIAFLTDPVFSQRCSPSQYFGPKRVTQPAFSTPLSPHFPHIDFIVISHNHYDHLDVASVKLLHKRFGDALTWYVPLGLKAWFHGVHIRNVVELDWWEEAQHSSNSDIKVVLTPAQHWSMRTALSRKRSLWGGFAVIGKKRRVWFAGDTGYCPVFEEIGRELGPFDLALIPTGAYEPRWFMKPQHIDPSDAVKVHKEVRSMRSVAIHLATFPLTDEAMDEPVVKLEEEKSKGGVAVEEFVTLRIGGMIVTGGGVDVGQVKTMPLPPTR